MNIDPEQRFRTHGVLFAAIAFAVVTGALVLHGAEINLLDKYPTTLTAGDAEPTRARPWEFSTSDIYALTAFDFRVGTGFRIETGPADLGIGHCADGAVWAVVLPRASGSLTSAISSTNEPVAHIWLRFHPAIVAEVFPPSTVAGPGDSRAAAQISIIANFKLRSSWHAGNNVMIPEPKDLTVDVDTVAGPRRFFAVDTAAVDAHYYADFEQRSVPVPPSITGDLATSAFDQLWGGFDKDYAMFVLRPEVDWQALRDKYRPLALASQSTYEFVGVCAEMLKPLRDLHVWLTLSGASVPVYDRPRPSNANPNAYPSLIGTLNTSSSSLQWAITPAKIGFIVIYNWTDSGVPGQFDAALAAMLDTRGLIVDVRLNGGGSEPLAQAVAARFLDHAVVYAYSQYRNGPAHTNLTELSTRSLAPRGPFRYDRPVLLLIGQRCMSSNESFIAMMTGASQVITMGDRTAGSSGNPEIIDLPLSIRVSVPRWIDYLPDRTTLDEKGIIPQVTFTPTPDSFTGLRDDLLSAALQRVRDQPLPPTPIVNPEDTRTDSGPTVCNLLLNDGKVYHSATLDLSEIHLQTRFGQLIIPTNDLIRLTFSSLPNSDTAATVDFVATGNVLEQTFSGHTPGGPFSFEQGELAEIDFGLPATLAARLPNAPLQVLWMAYSGSSSESIYQNGGMGYSQAALITENLGAGNTEVTEQVKLTPDLLAKYDLVVFINRDSGGSLSAAEKLALRDFLANGNSVLVIGQQDGGFPLSRAAQFANSITMPYGIELTSAGSRTPSASTRLISHPITKGISSAPGDGSLLRVTPPAEVLALTGTNTGVLAVSTFGPGKLVVVSDDSNFWDMSIDPKVSWDAERRTYTQNIFKWLLTRPPQLSARPRLDSDGYHLSVLAGIGQSVIVQRSADLVIWKDWMSVTATGSSQEFTDSSPTARAQFYRVVLP